MARNWTAIEQAQSNQLRSLFNDNPERVSQFSHHACGILFDFSKTHITDELIQQFSALAEESELENMRQRLFAGEVVNPRPQQDATPHQQSTWQHRQHGPGQSQDDQDHRQHPQNRCFHHRLSSWYVYKRCSSTKWPDSSATLRSSSKTVSSRGFVFLDS